MDPSYQLSRRVFGKSLLLTASLIIGLAFVSEAQVNIPASGQRLSLPKTKQQTAQPATSTMQKGTIPDTVPGSLPDLKNRLEELTRRVEQLEQSYTQRINRIESAYADIKNQMAKLTQDSRPPVCSADKTVSINPVNGAQDKCWPYACNAVTGLCRSSCTVTAECGSKAVCDWSSERCIKAQ